MADRALLQHIIERVQAESGMAAECRFGEPMSRHTTFQVGGPADLWVRPAGEGFPAFAAALLRIAGAAGTPVFVLGGGANLAAADRGVRGIVLDTGGWSGAEPGGNAGGDGDGGLGDLRWKPDGASSGVSAGIRFRAGTAVEAAVEAAADAGLSGLEFLAGMPGTVGGAVWMNARCYEKSVSGVLVETDILVTEEAGGPAPGGVFSGSNGGSAFAGGTAASAGIPVRRTLPFDPADWGYKKSPFQGTGALILSARFALEPRNGGEIRREMEAHVRDRERKGHYRFPSAGSAFRNNRDFGKPVGRIIDELGLRGLATGGAQVAPFHGNIIINTGGARAADIRALMDEVAARVRAATGFVLEPEILFVGEW
jgi:UDP-N-acetylmuramate dehydrogenase